MESGYCSGLGFPYVFFGTCFVEPVSVCFRVSIPVCVHVCELRVRCSTGMIRIWYGYDTDMIRVWYGMRLESTRMPDCIVEVIQLRHGGWEPTDIVRGEVKCSMATKPTGAVLIKWVGNNSPRFDERIFWQDVQSIVSVNDWDVSALSRVDLKPGDTVVVTTCRKTQ